MRAFLFPVALLFASTAFAQVRDRPVADPAAGPRLSNASISGKVEVVVERDRSPVRYARIVLTSKTDHNDTVRFTDGEGRYRFDRLASGSYTLHLEKPGFVFPWSGTPPTTDRFVDVLPDQVVNLDWVFTRAGALEGRFVDYRGVPLSKLFVTASRIVGGEPGTFTLDDEAQTTTDDLGRYRLHTLRPGRYVVNAVPPPPAAVGYRIYFPSTYEESQASAIVVSAGQTVGGLDVTVPAGPNAVDRPATPFVTDSPGAGAERGGSGRVRGVVVRGGSEQPVPFAAVAQIAVAQVAVASGGRVTSVRADATGQFEFAGVVPGTYQYLATNPPVGGALRTLNVVSLTVRDGVASTLRLVLPAPAAIEGRVLDEFGDPVPGVDVMPLQRIYAAGRWRLVPGGAGPGATDDLGRFRFYDLAPGDYWIEAVGVPFNRRSQVGGTWRAGGFAPTFYPGAESTLEAGLVHVVEGQDGGGITIPVKAALSARLSGQVVVTGSPSSGSVQIVVFRREGDDIDMLAMAAATATLDGVFQVDNLPPATYLVQASSANVFGTANVRVDEENVSLVVPVQPKRTAKGRVSFDTDGPAPARDRLELRLWPTDFTYGPVGMSGSAGKPDASGRFVLTGLASVGVITMAPLKGWAIASVKLRGEEISDRPFDFQSSDVDGLEVVLTNRLGSITGTVSDAGRSFSNASVIAVPEDNRLWRLPARIVQAQSEGEGNFEMTDLLPGRYLLIATQLPVLGSEPDPEWLSAHRALATPVVITERQNTTVSLVLRR